VAGNLSHFDILRIERVSAEASPAWWAFSNSGCSEAAKEK
jgi:hypothetical protein